MNLNFEVILTLATLFTGIVWLFDSLFLAKKRLVTQMGTALEKKNGMQKFIMIYGGMNIPETVKTSTLIEYSRSFFPILLFVLVLRTVAYEPYRIPSGSDKPTLLVGDLILVNKHIYGWRLPISNKEFIKSELPKIGDIVVFHWSSVDPSKDLIKRVIGVPGDHVTYKDKVLYINGIKASQEFVDNAMDTDGHRSPWPVLIKRENLMGVSHLIYVRPDVSDKDLEVVVPEGNYFVMGDNRDESYDSRFWGFVPVSDLKGKATYIWLSWNGFHDGWAHVIRWNRIGMKIQ